jgi:competence protein ComEC
MYGQGDSTIIRTKYNKVVIVDSGEEDSLFTYLLKHKIGKIDYLILSHFDSDHCGNAFDVLENIKVKNIVIGVQAEEYENCVKFLEIASKKSTRVIALKAGDVLKLDKETTFEVFFPEIEHTISDNKINNNSLVGKLKYNDFSMLFTGDIEEEAENYLATKYKEKLKSNILKVAHHGSKTSTTDAFFKYVNPQIALIGVR